MKILTLCNKSPFAASDGATREISSRLKSWAQNGWTVHALIADSRKHPFKATPVEGLVQHSAPVDLRVRPLPYLKALLGRHGPVAERFYSADFDKALTRLIQQVEFDWIILEHACMGVYLDRIHQLCDTPCFLRAPNVEHVLWQRLALAEHRPIRKLVSALNAWSMKGYEQGLWKQLSGVICLSDADRQYIATIVPTLPIACIGMPINIQAKPALAQTPSICFVGPAYWNPNLQGVQWFIKHVWPLIRQQRPETQCHLIGQGWDTHQAHLPGVITPGYVEDLELYLKRCRVHIAPLQSGSGLKIKVLDALASGLCVVSTTLGVEGLSQTASLPVLVADEPAAFARHCLNLMSDDQLYGHLQEEGLKWVSEYGSPDLISQQWHSWFHSWPSKS